MRDALNQLRDLVARGEGSSNLVLALIILLVVGLLLAIVIYAFYASSPRGRVKSVLDQKATSQRSGRWAVGVAAVALLVGALFAIDTYAERPSTCAQCHQDKKYAKSLSESPHKSVDCASCHGSSGITGPVRELATYARWVYGYALTKKEPVTRPGSVSSDPCLHCHSDITSGVAERGGIKVQHSDFLDAGYRCRECHNSVGHPEAVQEPSEPTMEKCLACHDGRTAPSECKTCHARDVNQVSYTGELPKVAMKVSDQKASCYRCHQEEKCTKCHGVRMPHPAEWVTPGTQNNHARQAFTDRTVCWRCHFTEKNVFQPSPSACSCHGFSSSPHGDTQAWVKEHGLQASGQKPGNNAACLTCHGQAFCNNCHDASILDRYSPVLGADTYEGAVKPKTFPKGSPPAVWE